VAVGLGDLLHALCIEKVVAGEKEIVEGMRLFESSDDTRPAYLKELKENRLFATVLRRRRSFTLYVFLPERAGRHRLLRMSFDAPYGRCPRG
jgi:hypothetical protein